MKKRIRIAAGCMISAAVVSGFFLSCTMNDKPVETVTPGTETDTAPAVTATETETTAAVSETQPASAKEPIALGDGLYQVFSNIKTDDAVKKHCQYGTLKYDREKADASATAYDKKLDFSSVPFESDVRYTSIVYCVPETQSAVFFSFSNEFYRSDLDLQSPELLFHFPDDMNGVYSILSFPNTDLLFFEGSLNNGSRCIGTIDPNQKDIQYIACDAAEVYPCNTGAMVCDRDALEKHRKSIAYYWESGKIYQIALGNPKESEWPPHISANGNYLFTLMQGKTKDGKPIDRYTVYDTKSGQVLKTLDKEFDSDVSHRGPTIFSYVGINEQAQCVYLQYHSYTAFEYYRLDFGD